MTTQETRLETDAVPISPLVMGLVLCGVLVLVFLSGRASKKTEAPADALSLPPAPPPDEPSIHGPEEAPSFEDAPNWPDTAIVPPPAGDPKYAPLE